MAVRIRDDDHDDYGDHDHDHDLCGTDSLRPSRV
jgi:hypothetical protein